MRNKVSNLVTSTDKEGKVNQTLISLMGLFQENDLSKTNSLQLDSLPYVRIPATRFSDCTIARLAILSDVVAALFCFRASFFFPVTNVKSSSSSVPAVLQVFPRSILRQPGSLQHTPWAPPGGVGEWSESTCLCPSMTSRKVVNSAPCRGFVKKSASIYNVGQCRIVMSCSRRVRSLIQKYRMLTCRDLGPAERMRPLRSTLSRFHCPVRNSFPRSIILGLP